MSTTSPQGRYHDLLTGPAGLVDDRGWRSNLVVDTGRVLLAAFVSRQSNSRGITRLVVGRGSPAWDSAGIPAPTRNDTQLVDPSPHVVRFGDLAIDFIDESGAVVAGPEPAIRIEFTFPPGRPVVPPGEDTYPLREFALFGRFGGEQRMINYVRHPVIHKGPDDTLTRTVRLVF